jgi:hypothetical protein
MEFTARAILFAFRGADDDSIRRSMRQRHGSPP